jgi:hypothetical protein
VLAGCGESGSSSGRVRNAAIQCFNTQEEKDAAVVLAQADVDAAVDGAQIVLDAVNAQPLCSEVESVPTETIVPPVEDEGAEACEISLIDNQTSADVSFCDRVMDHRRRK